MDGRENSIQAACLRLRHVVCVVFAGILLLDGQLSAEAPPLFELQGVPQPIDGADRASVRIEISSSNRSAMSNGQQRPALLRPKARVHSVAPSARIAVLAATNETDTSRPSNDIATPDIPLTGALSKSQAPVRMSVEQALETKGSVTFRKTALSEVVFLLSDLWHINIVAGENVSGEVSGAFHDAPLREVLSAALTATGYSYRKTGSSLIVLPIDQVGTDDPDFLSETIQLPSMLSDDEATLEAAQLLLSERGQMRKVGANAVLIVDTQKRIDRVRKLFMDLAPSREMTERASISSPSDQTLAGSPATGSVPEFVQSGIAYFTPQFTEAEEMGESLREALGDGPIVAVYREENRIMIKGTPDELRLASEAIAQLDKPRPQVRITAMIYDVSLKEIERLGVNWSARPHSGALALADLNDPESLRFRNLVTASTSLITDPSAPGAASFGVSTINDTLNVDTLIQALNSTSEAKLLADPSITVSDRVEASIRIVQKIPILAADPVENSGVVFSQVQFEEAGVILNVRPRISRDGTIELKVQPEYSVVADFIENNPVIDSRTAETTVRVGDGQMFALGGLRQKSIVETVRGVPCLKDLKYVGKLFRSHDTEVRESELIVFLTPELITPYCPGTLRQQYAGQLAIEQIDAIPHAETVPSTPCCKDPYCPNHHPRPRLNGGTESLEAQMLGGSGIQMMERYPPQELEVEIDVTEDAPQDSAGALAPVSLAQPPAEKQARDSIVQEAFPPIHIDPRAIQ